MTHSLGSTQADNVRLLMSSIQKHVSESCIPLMVLCIVSEACSLSSVFVVNIFLSLVHHSPNVLPLHVVVRKKQPKCPNNVYDALHSPIVTQSPLRSAPPRSYTLYSSRQ